MAWRGLHLSQPSRLSLADGQIVIDQDDGAVRLPIEDVAWLVLDTQHATLTAALLSACMDGGVAIISTDATHLPNGAMLPRSMGTTARRRSPSDRWRWGSH